MTMALASLGFLTSCSAKETSSAAARRVARARQILNGPGIQVDRGFGYYQDRSVESIAAEIKVNGYKHVHYVVTTDSAIKPELIRAFHKEGLPVWYMTFGHVAYSTADFPKGWESWRMKLRVPDSSGYTFVCMNDPGYIAYKRSQVDSAIAKYPFDGVELVEAFWPQVPGPVSETYACLCEDCRAAFLKMFPGEKAIPEFTDTASPLYYKKQPDLYRKWVDFRVRSIGRFVNESIKGIRQTRPNLPVMAWSLAQSDPNSVEMLREAQGNDAGPIAEICRPDAWCFQTNWTDWSKPDLNPNYVLTYKPFFQRLRRHRPDLPVTVQLDIGSNQGARQTKDWIWTADRHVRSMGGVGTLGYEYFIGRSVYDDPPKLVEVRPRPGGVSLVFQKRIDTGRAADPANYTVKDASGDSLVITGAKMDGNMVLLGVRGLRVGTSYAVTVKTIEDTPDRWLFRGYPKHTVTDLTKTFRHRATR